MRWSNIISAAYLVLLGTDLSSALPNNKKSSIIARNPNQPPKVVYRGDFRSPLEIAQQGGFRPRGDDAYANDASTFSTWRHTVGELAWEYNQEFLGQNRPDTSSNIPWASAFVSVAPTAAEGSRFGIWLYRIHAAPNMMDPTYAGEIYPEIFTVGGIHWGQVMGWYQINAANTAITDDNFTPNPSYDSSYDQFTTTRVDPALMHESPNDTERTWTELMNRPDVGSAVGFTGRYPLQFRTYPLDNLPGPVPLEQIPGTSAGAEAQFPSLTEDDMMLFAEFLQEQDAPCDISSVEPPAQALILEADSAIAYSMATINRQQQGAANPFANVDFEIQQILNNLTAAERPSTCSIISECSRINPQSPQKRAAALSKELCQKLRWPKKGANGGGKDASPSKKPVSTTTKTVFVGTYHWPEEVKQQGGLVPSTKDGTQALQAYLLLGMAAQDAAAKAKNETDGFHGVVYAVHVSPNMLLSGKDCVVVGGALWRQVIGWMQVPLDYVPPPKGPEERKKLQKNFEDAFREAAKDTNNPLFQKNPDYDPKFDALDATSKIPDLASPQALEDFMDATGKDVNWKGSFPLIQTQRISGPESKTAKKNNKVAPPHDASVWKKTTNFVANHKLAIALLPAVVLLNVVPGLGEAADAAEIAALSADAAETFEIAEASGEATELTPLVSKVKTD